MDVKGIFDEVIKVTNLNPLEVTVWLILIALFTWLYREFKLQFENTKKERITKNDASMIMYSKILGEEYVYRRTKKAEEFFKIIYEALPHMDYYTMNEILEILDDEKLEEYEKVKVIKEKIYGQVKSLSLDNKSTYSLTLRSPMDILTYLMSKLKDIVYPFGQTILTIYLLICLLLLWFSTNNIFMQTVRVAALIILFIIIFGVAELIYTKNFRTKSLVLLSLIIVCLILMLFQFNNTIVIISLISFFILFFILVFFGRVKK
ncbi:MAG: hypothetical protein ACQEV7_06975 [Bacillota bacterium]